MENLEDLAQSYAQSVVESNPNAKEAQGLIATSVIYGYQLADRPWEYSSELISFGSAINALKLGYKIRRKAWGNKNMFLWLKPATIVKAEWCKDPMLKELAIGNGGEIPAVGTICMYAEGEILTGWLASQTDILSEDWEICTMNPA